MGKNLHDIVREHAPAARMVYLDHDQMVVVHWRARLKTRGLAVVEGDALHPEKVLADPELRKLIDLDRPVGLIMSALVHFWPSEDVAPVMDAYLTALAPGSGLVLSHATTQGLFQDLLTLAVHAYEQPIHPRSADEITRLFDGLDLLPPGWWPFGTGRYTSALTGLRCSSAESP